MYHMILLQNLIQIFVNGILLGVWIKKWSEQEQQSFKVIINLCVVVSTPRFPILIKLQSFGLYY